LREITEYAARLNVTSFRVDRQAEEMMHKLLPHPTPRSNAAAD
jgi:hypothetical protein